MGAFLYALNVPTLFWTVQILKEGYFPNHTTLCVHIRNLKEGYIWESHVRGAHHPVRGLPYTYECSSSCTGASGCHVLLVHTSLPKIHAKTAPNRLQGRGAARSQRSRYQRSRNRTPGSRSPESRSIKQDSNSSGMIQNSPRAS